MIQYLNLLKEIKEKGTYKSAAREGMPGTLSRFGAQIRFDLSEGFPILTTKNISFKNIVTELLWFLRGDTNIKYLVDNGCNIWNEDAYNYYVKKLKQSYPENKPYDFETFIQIVKSNGLSSRFGDYEFGDCGKQYGWLWRHWEIDKRSLFDTGFKIIEKDQIKELIDGLKKNPMSRRHIITAWNPVTLDDMALNACHAFVQFNCRPLSFGQRLALSHNVKVQITDDWNEAFDKANIPKYYLDCQMYQRSADVFLGVPYNIASYALLTEILAKICNMVSGEFIHTFGDVHIYDNHMEQVDEQLTRTPDKLPRLGINETDWHFNTKVIPNLDFTSLDSNSFVLLDYKPQPSIKAKLSTGLK